MRNIVANFKMNGNKKFYQNCNKIFNQRKFKDTNLVLCPPFIYVPFIKAKNLNLGAQDISSFSSGSYTSQISANMLKEFGVTYAIIGHCERQDGNNEIALKVKQACQNGITPIVCVGETEKQQNQSVMERQIKSALKFASGKVIFAYEPVWAVKSGKTETAKQIQTKIKFIKNTAKSCGFEVEVLYGGGVNETNFNKLQCAELDGFMLGEACLVTNKFLKIIEG